MELQQAKKWHTRSNEARKSSECECGTDLLTSHPSPGWTGCGPASVAAPRPRTRSRTWPSWAHGPDSVLIGDSVDDAHAADAVGAGCVLYSGGFTDSERLRATGKLVA